MLASKTCEIASDPHASGFPEIQQQRDAKEVAQGNVGYESLLRKFLLYKTYLRPNVRARIGYFQQQILQRIFLRTFNEPRR